MISEQEDGVVSRPSRFWSEALPFANRFWSRTKWLVKSLLERTGADDGGADDGTRTRDPHLGKVMEKVQVDTYKSQTWAPI